MAGGLSGPGMAHHLYMIEKGNDTFSCWVRSASHTGHVIVSEVPAGCSPALGECYVQTVI